MKVIKLCSTLFLAVVVMLSGCSGGGTSTKNGTEGLSYTQTNGVYYVSGYTGAEVNVIIPDTHNDIDVTGVEEQAFHASEVQSIVFRKNISYIGENAFSGSTLLKTVTFNSPSIELDIGAFYSCSNLTSVAFKAKDYSVYVRSGAFDSCDALTELDLSGAAEGTFDITAAASDDNLKTLYLSEGITFLDAGGQRINPNISSINGTLLMCDAEIVYK